MTEQNFNNWNQLKQELHFEGKRKYFREKEIYFISVGQNIGYEILGKKKEFLRPVLVYKKLSHNSFLGIPLTSTQKEGSYYFQFVYTKNKISTALLNQIRVFDSKRIKYFSGKIKDNDFEKLRLQLAEFLNITPQNEGGILIKKDEQRKSTKIVSKNKLIVKISSNNIQERKYIIDILLGEFLGIDYEVIVDSDGWDIVLGNGNKLIIEDHFFGKFSKDLEYLKDENIPKNVEFAKNNFIVEDNIPIIYGNSQFSILNSQLIKCGIDIFASSFFMLTRWEEYVKKARDEHNRFPASDSLAFENNFLDRPVVNEYVEMLWNMLKFLGCKQERKKKEFELVLTHDIDTIYKYPTLKSGIKEIAGDLIKRKNINLFFHNLSLKIKSNIFMQDPYDTFDYLMDLSKKLGVKSYFFIHSSIDSKLDFDNDVYLKRIIDKILEKGHFIGFHPSYNSYNSLEIFKQNKEKIEKLIHHKLIFGRQHYLRFEAPITWQIWEDCQMEWDSSLGYADKEGFRCGVCYKFSVFNILSREKLDLKERPLIVMDGSFQKYQKDILQEEMQEKIQFLKNKVKKYNGDFVFLWHNSSFNTLKWKNYQKIYERVLNE